MISSDCFVPSSIGIGLPDATVLKLRELLGSVGGSFRGLARGPEAAETVRRLAPTVCLAGNVDAAEWAARVLLQHDTPCRVQYLGPPLRRVDVARLDGAGVSSFLFEPAGPLVVLDFIRRTHAATLELRRTLESSRDHGAGGPPGHGSGGTAHTPSANATTKARRDPHDARHFVDVYGLTWQRARVAHGVLRRQTNKEIAASMRLSLSMVKKHLAWLYDHFGVRSRHLLRHELQGHRAADGTSHSSVRDVGYVSAMAESWTG